MTLRNPGARAPFDLDVSSEPAGIRATLGGVESGGFAKPPDTPTSIEIYRRRARLRQALVRVDEAIELASAPVAAAAEPTVFGLERLRDDLLIALWLTELGLSSR